ncbi:MAG: TetR/AcrR family transcriptional regulator [Bdellovibrionales bacterium]|nr:TetR/AcrR family transcriptional regulator [Ramlibacter sp.]
MAATESTAIRDQLRNVKKDRIVDEARKLFYTHGFRGTSLDAIAESMGVTKPFVYGVYDKKTDILFDIALRNVHRSVEAVEGGAALAGTAGERLAEAARRLTRVCIEYREGVAVFFRDETSLDPEHHEVISALKQRIDDSLAHLLEEGAANGEFQLIDARTSALAIGGMISWSYVWFRPHGRLSMEMLMEQMAQYALRIAGAKPVA